MGEKERESSGVGGGVMVALVAMMVLAVPCIGGVLLLGLFSFRTVSVPVQQLPAPPLVAPSIPAPVVDPQSAPATPMTPPVGTPPSEAELQSDSAARPQ